MYGRTHQVAKALDALKEELHEAAWSYDKRKGALISRYGNLKERLEEQSQASGPQAKTSTKPTVHASLGKLTVARHAISPCICMLYRNRTCQSLTNVPIPL
eukprot:TRINITY_DN12550_c0_g1_i3.p7 TRINITY_DN12550_c0_g1~~TRINITY_DN12550_c0_g1_i3.p7  ORF type:complete len:101 (-),score=15.87 TRINITY_DN12550_c0_g1_i3:1496-1798(-)